MRANASINHKNNAGWTGLMIAANNGHQDVVELLIQNNADVHLKDPKRKNSLYLSAKNGFYIKLETTQKKNTNCEEKK